jgi:hypothetical protein
MRLPSVPEPVITLPAGSSIEQRARRPRGSQSAPECKRSIRLRAKSLVLLEVLRVILARAALL